MSSQGTTYTIGLVANTTWNIANFRRNIIRKFLNEGHKIVVFSPIDKHIHYKKEFVNVEHVPIKYLDRDSTNPLKDFRLYLELLYKYKKYKPDLLIHYTIKPNIYGALAARQAGIRSIGVITGLGFTMLHPGIINKISKFLYRQSLKKHDKVIFENIDDRELFIDIDLVNPQDSISIKGCGVDSSYYLPSKAKPQDQPVVFTFIGRLLYDKGIKEFVEASKALQQKMPNTFEAWVIGDLDEGNPSSVKKDELSEWVNQQVVQYFGFANDVREYISKSDCIVLPSYREAIARSITEGMSMEKPIITTDTAGCREAVDDGHNGYLIPVKDSKALSQAMEDFIMLSPESRIAMGKNGRQKVLSEFDEKIIADDIYALAIDVIGKSKISEDV